MTRTTAVWEMMDIMIATIMSSIPQLQHRDDRHQKKSSMLTRRDKCGEARRLGSRKNGLILQEATSNRGRISRRINWSSSLCFYKLLRWYC